MLRAQRKVTCTVLSWLSLPRHVFLSYAPDHSNLNATSVTRHHDAMAAVTVKGSQVLCPALLHQLCDHQRIATIASITTALAVARNSIHKVSHASIGM